MIIDSSLICHQSFVKCPTKFTWIVHCQKMYNSSHVCQGKEINDVPPNSNKLCMWLALLAIGLHHLPQRTKLQQQPLLLNMPFVCPIDKFKNYMFFVSQFSCEWGMYSVISTFSSCQDPQEFISNGGWARDGFMMARRYCYTEVLPFMAMVSVDCAGVGLKTLFKAASSKGMNYFVFIFYSYAFSTVVLLPLIFIFQRKRALPTLNLSILCRIFLLGMLGLSSQMIGYKGLEYSSPTLASAISNLMVAFTFILAVIFRMEKITLTSWRSCAKIMGTLVSISGALIMVLYKGPTVLSTSLSSNWVIGGLLLVTQYLLLSFWNIFQAHIMKLYPAELNVSFLYTLTVAILSAPICFMSERNPSSWRLGYDMTTVTVIFAGFFGPAFSTVIQSWGVRLKGPVYIASFCPLSIAIAAAMGFVFLGDVLTAGSVVGGLTISVGFYAVLWGKAQDDMSLEHGSKTTPLLQSQKLEVSICK